MKRTLDIEQWEQLPSSFEPKLQEVADITRTSYSHVRNLITDGLLKARRLRGKGRGPFRVEKRWVEEYLAECLFEPRPARREAITRRATGAPFKHLNGERLLAAWTHEDS